MSRFVLNVLFVLSVASVAICQTNKAADYSSALDKLLFESFCARPSVKTILGQCIPAGGFKCINNNKAASRSINEFGRDAYSTAPSGTITKTHETSSLARTKSFTIATDEKVRVTCNTLRPAPTHFNSFLYIFPVDANDKIVDLIGGIQESGPYAYELTGTFSKGASIVARVNFDLNCSWETVTSSE